MLKYLDEMSCQQLLNGLRKKAHVCACVCADRKKKQIESNRDKIPQLLHKIPNYYKTLGVFISLKVCLNEIQGKK